MIFSCNNLSKRIDRGILFEGVSFGMEQGERLGLIGKNGIGKTSLLKIIAGLDTPDEGSVIFKNDIKLEFLVQNPEFDSSEIIHDAVMKAKPELYNYLEEHNRLCSLLDKANSQEITDKVDVLTQKIENLRGWSLENDAKIILTKLGLTNFYDDVKILSGGLKKRVALAKVLLSAPDLLILDEPTNHLDAESVQWLQDRLMNASGSILFVTHDRYFLDAVATKIIEIDRKRLFSYPGNYEAYLEQKEAFVEAHNAAVEHAKAKLRTELAWLQKGARARRTKQKSRIDWIAELAAQEGKIKEKKIKIELGKTFMGSRVIDAFHIGKSIGSKLLFQNFTYLAKPGDRIGIIGPNGSGKSTFLNVLSGRMNPDEGKLKIGDSIKIGYFTQEAIELKDSQSLVGSLREIADYIDVGIGRDRYITAKELLDRFLFPHSQHTSLIGTLSGGEKRRLALLRVLMGNPNVLFLDEPTNDFDIPTLNALEEYLENFYGVLLVVSHDRAFLDRTIDFIYAFDGNGKIKEYPGNYSYYLEQKETALKNKHSAISSEKRIKPRKEISEQKKLSYLEQREFDSLEEKIENLEMEKAELELSINSGEIIDYKLLEEKSNLLVELEEKLDILTERWLELGEKIK